MEEVVVAFEEYLSRNMRPALEELSRNYPLKKSLVIDWKELDKYNYQLADQLLEKPDVYLGTAKEAVAQLNVILPSGEKFRPNIRISNLPEERDVLVQNLGAEHLNKLVSVQGVVSLTTDIKPKMHVAKWECLHCETIQTTKTDRNGIIPPGSCVCGRRDFKLLEEASEFVNVQRAQVQDFVERLRGSTPASHVELWLEDDLTNIIAPGEKLLITGILRLRAAKDKGKGKSNVYEKFVDVISVQKIEQEFEELKITKEEERELLELSRNPRLFDLITSSIAPSIYGYEEMKQAIALQLFGGTPDKVLPDGKKIRSDCHVMLIGDPGCLISDERIVLGNGAIAKLGEMGSEHLEKINQKILTGQGYKREVATVFHHYEKQPIIEIITESGKCIKGTYNHPLLVVDKRERIWKRLDELKVGDKLASVPWIPCTITKYLQTEWKGIKHHYGPHPKAIIPSSLTPEIAGFLGYILGDGWVTKTRVAFDVNSEEEDLIPLLSSIVEKNFGLKPKVRVERRLSKKRITIMELHSVDVAANLQFLRTKRVPDLILKSGNKVVSRFISWLFEADGCVFSKGRGKRAIQLKSSEIELLRDVQILLLRFGIHSRIVERNLTIRRAEAIGKFATHIGFNSEKKKSRLKKLVEDCRDLHHKFGKQLSERIVSIKKVGLKDVYDIEVPNGNRFIANGIISHNTAKSTLLMYVSDLAPKCIYVSGKGASGVGLCVAPDSLILNDAGFKPISEFVESNWNQSAKEEIPGAFGQDFNGNAWTLNDSLKITQKKISKIWRIRAPEKMFKVTTRMGYNITLTPATSLITINDLPAWKQAIQLNEGEFIAVARKLPEGNSSTPAIKSLLSCPHLRIEGNFAVLFKQITDVLARKFGSLQIVARRYGINDGDIYLNRSPKYWSNMELRLLTRMAKDTGFEKELADALTRNETKVFLRYGKSVLIPPLLENEKLAYLAGLLLGDGDTSSTKANQANLRFSNTSEELLNSFALNVKELFGITCSRSQSSWRIPSLRFSSMPAYLVLKEFGLEHKKTELKLSHAALCMPNNVLAALLRGLFDTDGYVSKAQRGSPHIGISTVSPHLARTLQLALLKFGIIAKLRVRHKAGTISRGKTVSITSRYDANVIEIRGIENFKLFAGNIGFNLIKKKESLQSLLRNVESNTNIDVIPLKPEFLKDLEWGYRKGHTRPSRKTLARSAEETGNPELAVLASSDVFWDQITRIESLRPDYEWVYDFSVDHSHNFICNGIFTHNTAAAEKDEVGEGWVLKAGAMVLASGGIVAIDEFDKMEESDRSAIHEALEQQQISIAKAGIVTRFKAKTSVLAAANPKYGRFDPSMPPAQQFEIPPTLLSRFDLIFPVKDVIDESRDRKMAEHILVGHKMAGVAGKGEAAIVPPIDVPFLRKYIAYARMHVRPQLGNEAAEKIKEYYIDLRKLGEKDKTFPVTARQIEGIVRLAEASAKARLSDKVEVADAERAIGLVNFMLQNVFVDRETGKIDSDIISIGQPKSRIDKVRSIISAISSLEKTMDLVSIDDVVREVASYDIDENYARRLIEELKRQGDLYEPRAGFIKSARAKTW